MDNVKWYFKTPALVIAFLCIGPFMLPLVWLHPKFDARKKVVISIAVVLISWLLAVFLARSVGSIEEYYKLLKQTL